MNNKPKKHKNPGVAGMDADGSDTVFLIFLVLIAAASIAIALAIPGGS